MKRERLGASSCSRKGPRGAREGGEIWRSLFTQGRPLAPSALSPLPLQRQTPCPMASWAAPGSEPALLQSGGVRGACQVGQHAKDLLHSLSWSHQGLLLLLGPGAPEPAVQSLQPLRSGPDLALARPELQPETDTCRWHPSCQPPSSPRDTSALTLWPLAGPP